MKDINKRSFSLISKMFDYAIDGTGTSSIISLIGVCWLIVAAFSLTALIVAAGFFSLLIIALPPTLPVIIMIILGVKRFIKSRQLQQLIISEYDPPAFLSPAEIGYLYDSKIGQFEVQATVVDLIQRGVISASDGEISSIDAGRDKAGGLSGIDRFIINGLTTGARLDSQLPVQADDFRVVVYKELQQKGYFSDDPMRGYLRSIAYITVVVAVSVLVAVESLFIIFYMTGDIGRASVYWGWIIPVLLVPAYSVAAWFIVVVYTKVAGMKWVGTKQLRKLWPKIEEYRVFIKVAELDRIHYEAEDIRAKIRAQYLPYAVVLGMDTGWQKRFDKPD